MIHSSVVNRRCFLLLASNCNNEQHFRCTNLFLPRYRASPQKHRALNFCSSKKTSKKDSAKSTNLRRVKKDPNDSRLEQFVSELTTIESNLSPESSSIDPILPSTPASSSFSNELDVSSMPRRDALFTSVYVHPLSQIVLNHFQTHCHAWIQSKRLDDNLVLHGDGTFLLQSTSRPLKSIRTSTSLTTASILLSKNFHSSSLSQSNDKDVGILSTTNAATPSAIRIWTTYDSAERKHWLCVSVDESRFSSKYLLQDNSLTPWQGFKLRSVPERICASVHDLMNAVNDYENCRKQR